MTDEELIARLRAWDGTPFDDDAEADADRIEEYTHAFANLQREYDARGERIEALVNEAVLNKAAYEGVSSLLLSVQQDCIKERQRAERLEAAMIQMRDDKTGFRHAVHFRRFITAALKGDDHE